MNQSYNLPDWNLEPAPPGSLTPGYDQSARQNMFGRAEFPNTYLRLLYPSKNVIINESVEIPAFAFASFDKVTKLIATAQILDTAAIIPPMRLLNSGFTNNILRSPSAPNDVEDALNMMHMVAILITGTLNDNQADVLGRYELRIGNEAINPGSTAAARPISTVNFTSNREMAGYGRRIGILHLISARKYRYRPTLNSPDNSRSLIFPRISPATLLQSVDAMQFNAVSMLSFDNLECHVITGSNLISETLLKLIKAESIEDLDELCRVMYAA